MFYGELIILLNLLFYQFRLIFPYWMFGIIAGSVISILAFGRIIDRILIAGTNRHWFGSIALSALLGAASPVCMYGTVPIIVALAKKGVAQYLLAAFMVSSILLNPNLLVYSFVLGIPLALLRLFICITAGIVAGLIVRIFFKGKTLLDYKSFSEKKKCNTGTPTIITFLSDLNRAVVKTGPYFLIGILLTALFERYFPKSLIIDLFGREKSFGVLLAASLGIPVYVCGGGTIPLLKAWLTNGMSPGAAVAFMVTGPATKLTNLGAVKIILGIRNFTFYISFNIIFAVITGFIVDLFYRIVS